MHAAIITLLAMTTPTTDDGLCMTLDGIPIASVEGAFRACHAASTNLLYVR